MVYSGYHFELICELTPYMAHRGEKEQSDSHVKVYKPEKKADGRMWFGKSQDNLLNCLVLTIEKEDKMETMTDTKMHKEMKEEAIKRCKEEKGTRLKPVKMSGGNFCNALFSCSKLDNELFFGMCVYMGKCIGMRKGGVLYIFGEGDNLDGVITVEGSGTYFETGCVDNMEEYVIVRNPIRPLKSVSSYKISELTDLCRKLEVNIDHDGKRRTKQLLYDDVKTKIII